MDAQTGFDLLVAALVGLAIGLEREWSGHVSGPDARFAGLRTFAMLGALGGFGGWLVRIEQPLPAACVIGGTLLLVIVAYAAAMRRPGTTVDGTTEVAALLVVTLGIVAGLGFRSIASASTAIVLVLLSEKSTFQNAIKRVESTELRASVQFGVLALVVLPLLPDGRYGPYGAVQLRQLWYVVLLFSAINFAGYIARRVIGESRGVGFLGLLGGLVSSTAVTLSFSRRSRLEPTLVAPLAFGVTGACTVLLPRVLVMATAMQRSLFPELGVLLGVPFVVGVGMLAAGYWFTPSLRTTAVATDPTGADASSGAQGLAAPLALGAPSAMSDTLKNPLALGVSIQLAVALQVALVVIAWVNDTLGNTGVLTTAAMLGLTDMDALTIAMTRLAQDATQTHIAALAIGIGVIANTLLKTGVILVLGSSRFRLRAASALIVLGLASGMVLWWCW